jgi:GNAT superfamily N-acetyltransferase
MLSTLAYWARWREREHFEAQLASAWRIVGVYEPGTGQQVGYARAISDGLNEAYLVDVIVDPGHRGRGVGKLLLRTMIDDGPGAEFRWTLFTNDAHGLYEQFGFGDPGPTAMVRPSTRRA